MHRLTATDPGTQAYAETDTQTQGDHRATKPEKHTQTQVQEETGRHAQTDPQTQTDIHTRPQQIPAPGTPSCPLAHSGEEAAKTAGTLVPEHGLSSELPGSHGPQPPLFLRLP